MEKTISISMSVSESALEKFREFKRLANVNQHEGMSFVLDNLNTDALVKQYKEMNK